MPNIGSLLREEINRLCRKEIRKQVGPLRKAAAGYRHDIAGLKRRLADAERNVQSVARRASELGTVPAPAAGDGRPTRFVAKGLRAMRTRLGLSAPELATLLGVSAQSVYNWETKKAVPRKEQLAAIVALRGVGKREARARLDGGGEKPETAAPAPKPAKAAKSAKRAKAAKRAKRAARKS